MHDAPARREIALLLAILAADAVFYFVVIPHGIADPDGFGLGQGLPPSFTARFATILIAVIVCVRLFRLLIGPVAIGGAGAHDPGGASDPTDADAGEPEAGLRNLAGIVCALIFAFVLVPFVGYYAASVCMIGALMLVMGETRWLYLIGQPVAVMGPDLGAV